MNTSSDGTSAGEGSEENRRNVEGASYGIHRSDIQSVSMGSSSHTGDVHNVTSTGNTTMHCPGGLASCSEANVGAIYSGPVNQNITINQQVMMQPGHRPSIAPGHQQQPGHFGSYHPQQVEYPAGSMGGQSGMQFQPPAYGNNRYPSAQSHYQRTGPTYGYRYNDHQSHGPQQPWSQQQSGQISPQGQHFGRAAPAHQYTQGYPSQPSVSYQQAQPVQPPRGRVKILTSSISAWTDEPLSAKAHVYPGQQTMGLLVEPRLVAIKVVKHSEKKMREARNLVKLTPHVNVVSIYHADNLDGSFEPRIYIVMERCNPRTLENYIKDRKLAKVPFNPTHALDMSKQIIEGMNHIHKNNIIHRDLKPGSVLFSMCGKFLKIIDFGMSKELKRGLSVMSLSTLPLGTDGYRAPETYNKDLINKQADIFSLGILLYHIWSDGFHPFGRGPDIWSFNIKEHNPPDFSKLLIPDKDSAADLLTGMLKIEPAERSTIDDVKAHPFIKQSIEDAVRKAVTIAWEGSIEQIQTASMSTENFDNCSLLTNNVEPTFEIGRDWELRLQYVPKMSRMAWIDMLNSNGERVKSLLVIRPKEYDDLHGIFITNPDEFMAGITDQVPEGEETVPKQPVGDNDELARGSSQAEEPSNNMMSQTSDMSAEISTAQPSHSEFSGQEESFAAGPKEEVPEVTPQEATPSARPVGQLEFIAWWILGSDATAPGTTEGGSTATPGAS